MRSRTVVGLDIGTSSVRAAELDLGKGPMLQKFGQVALPPGAVHDGEVNDVAAVSAALRRLWRDVRFSTRHVVVGVANSKVIVRQVDLPVLPGDEMRRALPFQVSDVIPMPVGDAILDYLPLETVTGETGAPALRALLVAADRAMVSRAVQALRGARLTPDAIDLTPFAVLRAATLGSPPACEALVDVGASVTNICIHRDGVPVFVRILMQGGAALTEVVADRLGVPVEQAEAVKQELGMRPVALPDQPPPPEPASSEPAADTGHLDQWPFGADAFRKGLPEADAPTAPLPSPTVQHPGQVVLDTAAATFVEEIRASINYCLSQATNLRLTRIVISGGGARLTNLADRLSTACRLPVVRAEPLAALRLGRTGLSPDQLAYLEPMTVVPLGLALGRAA